MAIEDARGLVQIHKHEGSNIQRHSQDKTMKKIKSLNYLQSKTPISDSLPLYCVYPPSAPPIPPGSPEYGSPNFPVQGPLPNGPVYSPRPPMNSPPKYVPRPTPPKPASPKSPSPPLAYPYPPPSAQAPPYRGPSFAVWCVAKPTVPDKIIQEALDYACGSGADCSPIEPSGSCFVPNTLLAHASYAFNSYWQKKKVVGGTCDFGGIAMLVSRDPSK
ncbi:X8 domain [Dillenia turbinata]|uniref:X8 domain n=1 Tax=Dillenia turbinata TaxID=194707 RepID=A0AAN8Z289_9MAGN